MNITFGSGRRFLDKTMSTSSSTAATPAPAKVPSYEFLLNQVDWLSLQLEEVGRILRLPPTKTMKDLVEHAKAQMAELDRLSPLKP